MFADKQTLAQSLLDELDEAVVQRLERDTDHDDLLFDSALKHLLEKEHEQCAQAERSAMLQVCRQWFGDLQDRRDDLRQRADVLQEQLDTIQETERKRVSLSVQHNQCLLSL